MYERESKNVMLKEKKLEKNGLKLQISELEKHL